jgi:lipopolysaccharide/colanic/teichoic acid biosynthesis glycosyltransferase
MLTKMNALEASTEMPTDEMNEAILQFRRPTQEVAEPAFTTGQRIYLPIRRVFDLALAIPLTLLAIPIVVAAALAVKLTSRGPAFYTQTRTGKNGTTFTIFKIRSMIHNCESLTGPRWTIPGDPRVTAVGWFLRRSHIDELPQLWNVLKGEMSLIGPRPERPEFVAELSEAIADYDKRHHVLPGITGLAQVQLAPDTEVESVRRKLRYDLYAITNLNFWLDVRILVATVLHMLGLSFDRMQRMHIVPGPSIVERDEPVESPRVQRHAA